MIVAQTNLQLFNQLNRLGYSHPELGEIRFAYDLSRELFSGLYRPSGKTFIAHLIGTASILAGCRARIDVIKAGLMHAAYEAGDFGNGKKGVTDFKRNQIENVIGASAENLVYSYDQFLWPPANMQDFSRLSSAANPASRDVALMRLANELEEFTDLGFSYCHDSAQQRISFDLTVRDVLIKTAFELGHRHLSSALEEALASAPGANVPESVRSQETSGRSVLIMPRTYQNIMQAVATRINP